MCPEPREPAALGKEGFVIIGGDAGQLPASEDRASARTIQTCLLRQLGEASIFAFRKENEMVPLCGTKDQSATHVHRERKIFLHVCESLLFIVS